MLALRDRSGVSGSRAVWLCLCGLTVIGCRQDGAQTGAPRDTMTSAPGADQLLLAAAKVVLPPPGVAPADLPDPNTPGARAVAKFCVACHALPLPSSHSATDWPQVLRRMWARMDGLVQQFSVPVPTTADRLSIAQYMIANALKVSGANLPPGPGRELFEVTCSRCHELADPRQHTAADWVAVVTRMRQHMEQMLGLSLSRNDLEQIVLYLESASKATRKP